MPVPALAIRKEGSATLAREDCFVPSDAGIEIFVRRLDCRERGGGIPVLLMHGVRVPGIASVDLDVESGSLAADIARAGHPVFVMDARGFGASSRPADRGVPLARSNEVVRDIAAVVDHIRAATGFDAIACLGWATGGHWLGYHASLHPESISHIVLSITLYPQERGHPLFGEGSSFADPERPERFNRGAYGGYLRNDRAALLRWWDASIPIVEKDRWRDPALVEAYVERALASDAFSRAQSPGSFLSPAGAMEDSFYLATGQRFWSASLITARALVVSAGLDFWARPSDRDALAAGLTSAKSVEVLDLPHSTHYLHLDRPEKGRSEMLRHVLRFFGQHP